MDRGEGNTGLWEEFNKVTAVGKKWFLNLLVLVCKLRKW